MHYSKNYFHIDQFENRKHERTQCTQISIPDADSYDQVTQNRWGKLILFVQGGTINVGVKLRVRLKKWKIIGNLPILFIGYWRYWTVISIGIKSTRSYSEFITDGRNSHWAIIIGKSVIDQNALSFSVYLCSLETESFSCGVFSSEVNPHK